MSIEFLRALVLVAVAAALAAGGFAAGWSWQGARGAARVTKLQGDHAAERERIATETATRLRAARDLADQVATNAAAREAEQDRQLQEAHRALKTATRGRPCLGGAALRVLDHSPGIQLGPVQLHPGPSVDGPAAPAADPEDADGVASDTDVAGWIATAGALYESCRGRIRDIRAVSVHD